MPYQKGIFIEPFPLVLVAGGDLNGNDNNALAEGAEGEENGTQQQQPTIGFAAGLMMKALNIFILKLSFLFSNYFFSISVSF